MMARRPLPDSEEARRKKREKRRSRAIWIGVLLFSLLLAVFALVRLL